MPVEAVIAGSTPRSRRYFTYVLTVCDFPLPGSPVRKTFTPVFNISSAPAWVIRAVCLKRPQKEKPPLRYGTKEPVAFSSVRRRGGRLTCHLFPVGQRRITSSNLWNSKLIAHGERI